MLSLEDKFRMLGVDSAPGQEVNAHGIPEGIVGECLEGARVDFSHGDGDAFTEEFKSKERCIRWLAGEKFYDDDDEDEVDGAVSDVRAG